MAVPVATPVTTPEPPMVATSVLLLVHDTLVAVGSLNDTVNPWHTLNVPMIGTGF